MVHVMMTLMQVKSPVLIEQLKKAKKEIKETILEI
jgi:hypothetical protein